MFQVEIPDGTCEVVDSHRATEAAPAIACLVTAVATDDYARELARVADEQFAIVLEALLRAGITLVCVEGMDGSGGDPCAMGIRVAQLLREQGAKVIGVDDLTVAEEMRDVQRFASAHQTTHGLLFNRARVYLAEAVRSLGQAPVAKFLSLRMQDDADEVTLHEVARNLLVIAEHTDITIPHDLHRRLMAIASGDSIDATIAMREQEELLTRIRVCADQEVIDRSMTTTFAASFPGRTQGMRFTHGERAAIEYCQTLLHDISVAFSGNLEQVRMYQAICKYDPFEMIFDTARLLGIDVKPYANFCRYVGFKRLLPENTGALLQLLPQIRREAWTLFESRIPRTTEERRLVAAVVQHSVLRKLAFLQATSSEFDLIAAEDQSLERLLNEVQSITGILIPANLSSPVEDFDHSRARLAHFYNSARRRAKGMATRTLTAMKAYNTDRAALIFLGFHQPVITASLTAANASWTVLFPKYESNS